MTKVYVSGPMSGIEEFNHPAFREATEDLRARGYEVISPHELDDPEVLDKHDPHTFEAESWLSFILRDLELIVKEEIETIAVLSGWARSRGANMEVMLARQLGLEVVEYPSMLPLADRSLFALPGLPSIIGLTGHARAGKDTVAEFLLEMAEGRAVRQGFADALKVSACRALGIAGSDPELIEFCNWLKTEGSVLVFDKLGQTKSRQTGRSFLQCYGTEAHREVFGDDFWLDAVLPEGREDFDVLVIPDVRFENEARRIIDRGGEVWRIERPDLSANDTHASELPLPPELVSATIVNDGTLDVLRWKVADTFGLPATAAVA